MMENKARGDMDEGLGSALLKLLLVLKAAIKNGQPKTRPKSQTRLDFITVHI